MPDKLLIDAEAGVVIDTVVAGALVDGDGAPGGEEPVLGAMCSNCHTALQGRHCHHCGQVADTFHRPVWALFSEILEGYLGLDGRLWRTVPDILFRPGKVTARYLKGVRQPYMSPFRLFLLSSLLFFLTFAMLVSNNDFISKAPKQGISAEDRADIQSALVQAKNELEASSESATVKARTKKRIAFIEGELGRQNRANSSTPSAYGTGQRLACALRAELLPQDPLSETCTAIQAEENAQDQGDTATSGDGGEKAALDADIYVEAPILTGLSVETKRFIANNVETAVNDPAQYLATLSRWAPRLAFVLAPAYGLLLAVSFFWRRDIFIYDHMVVALHFHAFLFLFLILLVPVALFAGVGYAGAIFALWSNYYLYRLFRRVYRTSRAGAVVRVFVLDNIYLVLLTAAFMSLLVLGIVFV